MAGIVHAATVTAVVLAAGGAAEAIPLPVLAAVLVTVAINMGEVRGDKLVRNATVCFHSPAQSPASVADSLIHYLALQLVNYLSGP